MFDFAEGRGGQHVRGFLNLEANAGKDGWHGKLVCDDFSGYNACFELGVTEVGCLAHARREFHELWVNHGSQVGERALKFFGELYDIEREVRELKPEERRRIRQERSDKVARALQQWLQQQRALVPEGSATVKAIDYSLRRWDALTRFIGDGDLPADNNWVENQIRPIAVGRVDQAANATRRPYRGTVAASLAARRRGLTCVSRRRGVMPARLRICDPMVPANRRSTPARSRSTQFQPMAWRDRTAAR